MRTDRPWPWARLRTPSFSSPKYHATQYRIPWISHLIRTHTQALFESFRRLLGKEQGSADDTGSGVGQAERSEVQSAYEKGITNYPERGSEPRSSMISLRTRITSFLLHSSSGKCMASASRSTSPTPFRHASGDSRPAMKQPGHQGGLLNDRFH